MSVCVCSSLNERCKIGAKTVPITLSLRYLWYLLVWRHTRTCICFNNLVWSGLGTNSTILVVYICFTNGCSTTQHTGVYTSGIFFFKWTCCDFRMTSSACLVVLLYRLSTCILFYIWIDIWHPTQEHHIRFKLARQIQCVHIRNRKWLWQFTSICMKSI